MQSHPSKAGHTIIFLSQMKMFRLKEVYSPFCSFIKYFSDYCVHYRCLEESWEQKKNNFCPQGTYNLVKREIIK